jgi:hypothetical protein
VSPSDLTNSWSFPFGKPISLDLSVDAHPAVASIDLGFAISSGRGFDLASWTNKCSGALLPVRPGINTFRIGIEHIQLLPGHYLLGFAVRDDRGGEDYVLEAVSLEITSSSAAAEINAERLPGGLIFPATISILP